MLGSQEALARASNCTVCEGGGGAYTPAWVSTVKKLRAKVYWSFLGAGKPWRSKGKGLVVRRSKQSRVPWCRGCYGLCCTETVQKVAAGHRDGCHLGYGGSCIVWTPCCTDAEVSRGGGCGRRCHRSHVAWKTAGDCFGGEPAEEQRPETEVRPEAERLLGGCEVERGGLSVLVGRRGVGRLK